MSGARIVRDDAEALVVRVGLGSDWHLLGRASLFIIGIFLSLGLVALFALGRARTLTCRRDPAQCELREQGFFGARADLIPRAQIVAVEVEQSLTKCQTKLRTRNDTLPLSLLFTLKCAEQRRNAATVNAFLASPSEPALVVRFEERAMLYAYAGSFFGAAAVGLLATFWPSTLVVRIDRRKRLLSWRKVVRPWRRDARVIPLAKVAKLSIEAGDDSALRIELSLDDRTSTVARGYGAIDPHAVALARDRIAAVLAEERDRRAHDSERL